MLKKLQMLPALARLKLAGLMDEFKNDERGLSGVVVAVMLVVVAILAVVLVWTLLGDSIQTWWTNLVDGGATPTGTT